MQANSIDGAAMGLGKNREPSLDLFDRQSDAVGARWPL